jgi:peptidyl-tRNA hydrolase, PTH2 family
MAKQVILIRKDLGMRKGKMIAQGAHASMLVLLKPARVVGLDFCIPLPNKEWFDWLLGTFTKVVVGVDSEKELLSMIEKAEAKGLPNSIIQDAGKTEFHGIPTYTAGAIGPANDEEIDEITGELKLL